MRKRLCAAILCAIFIISFVPTAFAEGYPPVAVYVDGVQIDTEGRSYLRSDTTYVPVRELCTALGAEVCWTGSAAEIKAEGLELTVTPGLRYITANGRCIYIKYGCWIEGGVLMAPVRQISTAFGAEVEWNGEEKTVNITTGGKPILSGVEYYNEDDIYWLSRIIHAEASGESLEGKIAVGNVVLNRVQSPVFPNSIYDVIYDRRYSIQFTPAWTGSVKRTPSAESVAAAKMALEGIDMAGPSLYFAAARVAASSWAGKNRPFVTRIGNHCFYA